MSERPGDAASRHAVRLQRWLPESSGRPGSLEARNAPGDLARVYRARSNVSAEKRLEPGRGSRSTPPDPVAEGVGFEPTRPCGLHALQACQINHSCTPPGAVLIRRLDGPTDLPLSEVYTGGARILKRFPRGRERPSARYLRAVRGPYWPDELGIAVGAASDQVKLLKTQLSRGTESLTMSSQCKRATYTRWPFRVAEATMPRPALSV